MPFPHSRWMYRAVLLQGQGVRPGGAVKARFAAVERRDVPTAVAPRAILSAATQSEVANCRFHVFTRMIASELIFDTSEGPDVQRACIHFRCEQRVRKRPGAHQARPGY